MYETGDSFIFIQKELRKMFVGSKGQTGFVQEPEPGLEIGYAWALFVIKCGDAITRPLETLICSKSKISKAGKLKLYQLFFLNR